jgi:hypothetical protein
MRIHKDTRGSGHQSIIPYVNFFCIAPKDLGVQSLMKLVCMVGVCLRKA